MLTFMLSYTELTSNRFRVLESSDREVHNNKYVFFVVNCLVGKKRDCFGCISHFDTIGLVI